MKSLSNVWSFAFYVLLQGIILNHILLFGTINPYLYIMFIIYQPISTSRPWLMILGFFLGLAVDMLTGTPGINAFATVLLAYIKPKFDSVFSQHDDTNKMLVPSSKSFGVGMFSRYIAILTFIHHFVLFAFEAMDFSLILSILYKTVTSSLFTLLLVFFVEYYNYKRKDND